jgi:hypothetical protein
LVSCRKKENNFRLFNKNEGVMPHTNAGSFIQGLASKITTHFDTFILDAG